MNHVRFIDARGCQAQEKKDATGKVFSRAHPGSAETSSKKKDVLPKNKKGGIGKRLCKKKEKKKGNPTHLWSGEEGRLGG